MNSTSFHSLTLLIVADPPIAQLAKAEVLKSSDNEVEVFDSLDKAIEYLDDNLCDALICQQKLLEAYGEGRSWRDAVQHQPLVMLIERSPTMRGYQPFDRHVDGVISLSELNGSAILREVRNAVGFNQLQGQFRGVLDKSPDGIVILNSHGEITYANQAAAELFLRRPADMRGSNLGIPLIAESAEIDLPAGRTGEIRKVDIEWMGEDAILINIRDISAHKRAERSLAHAAAHDSLTALPNRVRFQALLTEAISHANRASDRIAVLFIDLDKFKEVNDTLGHDAGDKLLQTVADRLRADSREGTVVARLGGDEFIMLVRGVREGSELTLANRLLEDLKLPVFIAGEDVQIGASIGVAVFPDAGREANALIAAADAAMYDAKEAGRDRVKVYAGRSSVIASRRQQVEAEIRNALVRREMHLSYQPLFDVFGHRTSVVEALLRWHSPTLGVVPPNEFIPLSESRNWVNAIGRWCVVEVCRQIGQWQQDQSLEYRPDTVSLNISISQLADPSLPQFVARVLSETSVDARQLKLEITEADFLQNGDDCREIIEDLRHLGIELVMDEFGTGGLPLEDIALLPVDMLKIDRSLFANTNAINRFRDELGHIVKAAREASIAVAAVGVEDKSVIELLVELGIDYAQGFYFKKPMTADEITSIEQ